MANDLKLINEAASQPLEESRPSVQNMKSALKNILSANIDSSQLLLKLWASREHIEREINSQFRDEADFADWIADYMMNAFEDLEEEFRVYDFDDL